MAITSKQNGRRFKALITITAGTPIFVTSGAEAVKADRIQIQMLHGGAGRGLVYDDVPPGTLPADVAAVAGQPAELAAADANNPGGEYTDNAGNGSIDLREIAVDGSNTGDQVLVNAHLKI